MEAKNKTIYKNSDAAFYTIYEQLIYNISKTL